MDLYIEVSIDQARMQRGQIISRWFMDGLESVLSDLANSAEWYAVLNREEYSNAESFEGGREKQIAFLEGLHCSPYYAQLAFHSRDEQLGWLSTSSAFFDGAYASNVAALPGDDSDLADPAYCASLVEFLSGALSGANPAFGRVEVGDFSDQTNLDVVLRRKRRDSVPQSRRILRGYAWVTICPEELLQRLGGCDALASSGAFFRVLSIEGGVQFFSLARLWRAILMG